MATALTWADLDRTQTTQLCRVEPWTYENVSRLLSEFLELDPTTPQGEILMKLYFLNMRFSVENRFSAEKASTLFSVLKLVHFTSMDRCLTAEQSVAELKQVLVAHAVERPPYSVGVFSAEDMRQVMDFAADSYYRHYKLYRYVFTARRLLDFSIKPDGVEVPPPILSLADATADADVRQPDVEQVAADEPKQLTPEEEAAAEEAADEKLLEDGDDEKSQMVQKLVQKRLEGVKEQVEKDFAEQEAAYQARIAELEAKLAAQ